MAAQSIGEPGTQLTLRTFHVGGTASGSADESDLKAKTNGVVEIEELRTINLKTAEGNKEVVIGRSAEMRIVDEKSGITLMTANIQYGSEMMIANGAKVKKGDVICKWDPYNAVIVSEVKGKVVFDSVIEVVTVREEVD